MVCYKIAILLYVIYSYLGAAEYGKMEAVHELVTLGTNVNFSVNGTALYYAVGAGHFQVL